MTSLGIFAFALSNLAAQNIDFDSLKLEPLRQYHTEKTLKDKYLRQIMGQIQEANAAIVPDSLADVLQGFPKEFMRQTYIDKKPQAKKNTAENAGDYQGRYRTYFRDEMHQIPDYEQDLRSNGY